MDKVLQAVIAAFNNSPTLPTLFPSGLYHNLGPNELPLPLCSVKVSKDATNYDTGNDYEAEYRVHFDVWAETDTHCLDAIRALSVALLFQPLSISGATHLVTYPVDGTENVDREDETAWRGMVDYRISVEETY